MLLAQMAEAGRRDTMQNIFSWAFAHNIFIYTSSRNIHKERVKFHQITGQMPWANVIIRSYLANVVIVVQGNGWDVHVTQEYADLKPRVNHVSALKADIIGPRQLLLSGKNSADDVKSPTTQSVFFVISAFQHFELATMNHDTFR